MKFKKIFISLFLAIMALGMFTTSVFARSCGKAIVDEIQELEDALVEAGCSEITSGKCRTLYNNLQEAIEFKNRNCPCTGGDGYPSSRNNPYTYRVLPYKTDGRQIGRFDQFSDAFCVQKDVIYSVCGDYNVYQESKSIVDNTVKVIWGYLDNGNTSDEFYACAQAMIWGTSIPDNLGYAAEAIRAHFPENSSITEKYTVDVNPDKFKLNLNDSDVATDKNSAINSKYSDHFALDYNKSYLTVSRSNNKINFTMKSIYPLSKTVKVKVVGDDLVDVNGIKSINATIYDSPTSQKFWGFNGTITNLKYAKFTGDSFEITTPTGSATIVKLDEWGRPVSKGQKFKVWYAVEDENGEFEYEGKKYSKYKPFQTEADWKKGVEQSTFVTGSDSKVTIDKLPSGGKFDDGTAIGMYIVQEVEATQEYILNPNGYVFKVNEDKTTEVEIKNDARTISFSTFKQDAEENYRKINDAEFTIYDISDVVDLNMDAQDESTCLLKGGNWDGSCKYPTQNFYFAKVGKTYNLRDVAESEFPSLVGDNHPLKYTLNQPSLATVSTTGNMNALKVGNLEITVSYGSWDLYSNHNIKGEKVYQGETYDPYDMKFYTNKEGTDELEIESISYTGTFSPNVIGDYTLHYTIIAKNHVKYEFDRILNVVEEDRHECKPVAGSTKCQYLDTKEECECIHDMKNDEKKIYDVVVSNLDKKQGDIGNVSLKIIKDDDTITSYDFDKKTVLPLFKGLTGHNYVQTVNYKNHNLWEEGQQFILYKDETFSQKAWIYEGSGELGVIDLLDPNWVEYWGSDYHKEDLCIAEGGTWDGQTCSIEITVPDKPEGDIQTEFYYKGYGNKAMKVTTVPEDGKLNMPNLKHSRTLLVCETQLPEGYDFGNSNSCFILDTSKYTKEEIEQSSILENMIRRLDVAIYKVNNGTKYKLNGAVFDVYDIFEEGEDMNEIKHIKDTLPLLKTTDGVEYYENALGPTTNGSCKLYEEVPGVGKAIAIKDNTTYTPKGTYVIDTDTTHYNINTQPINKKVYMYKYKKYYDATSIITDSQEYKTTYFSIDEYNKENPDNPLYVLEYEVVDCYRKYVPDTVERKYYGRYISGGIYDTYLYNDANELIRLNNGQGYIPNKNTKYLADAYIQVSTDENFNNIIKTVKTSKKGVVKILGLNDGIYYTRLRRPLKPDFKEQEVLPDGTIVIHIPTEDDYVPYDELPDIYKEVTKNYVASGMVMMPDIKYGHTMLYREIEAPDGFYFDDPDMIVTPKSPYGIVVMENYRPNSAIIISKTGIGKCKLSDKYKGT